MKNQKTITRTNKHEITAAVIFIVERLICLLKPKEGEFCSIIP